VRTIVPARRSGARPAVAAAALVIATAGITHYMTRTIYETQRTATAGSTSPSVKAPSPDTPDRVDSAEQQVATNPITPPTPSGDNGGTATGQPGAQRATERKRIDVASNRAPSRRAASSSTRLVSANSVMSETEPVYDREISKLRTIVKSRRSSLDPKTIAVLEQSIAVIDSAIAQSRSALAKDPASGFLANQLNHSLEKKVELLRTAAMLPART
jgi:hypothetical protein